MGDYSTILHNKQKHLGDSCCCSVIVRLWLFGLPLIPPSNHPEGTLLFFGWSLGFPLFSCTHLPVIRFLNFSIKGPALPSILCQIVCLQQVANTLFLSSFLAFLFSRASVCSHVPPISWIAFRFRYLPSDEKVGSFTVPTWITLHYSSICLLTHLRQRLPELNQHTVPSFLESLLLPPDPEEAPVLFPWPLSTYLNVFICTVNKDCNTLIRVSVGSAFGSTRLLQE